RDVPDVSFTASPSTDGYLICSEGSCVNGFRAADQTLNVVGGTSAAAPTMAGVLAIIAGGTGSTGLANANPTLYALAVSAPSAFHDVTTGNNIVPCKHGTPNCAATAPFEMGYSAGVGYDRVTGLGSVDANVLAGQWAAKVATATTLAVSSATPAIGSNETLTATVTPAGAGFGSPAGGAVQFSIDGADLGAPVPVSNGAGGSTAVYSTPSLPGGAHSVRAAYTGNLVYLASSSAPVAITVSDFSIAANPPSVTVSPGGSATTTLTVSALDGFAGTVSLGCAPSNANAEITCSVQPAAVTLGGGTTSQTASLQITTAAPHSLGAAAVDLLGGEMLAALTLLALPLPRRRKRALGIGLLLLASASCGGGGSGGPAPAVPANLVATAGDLQVMLTWSETGKATHYGVERSTASGGPYTTIAKPAAMSFTDTGLTGGTTYYYVVDAASASGTSKASGEVAATPTNPGTPAGTYSIGVTGSSGAATHSFSVALTVQ
ncbi:MAG: Ig-like domain repeat protein, partial [Myxococcota bacterium]